MNRTLSGTMVLVCLLAAAGCASAPRGTPIVAAAELPATRPAAAPSRPSVSPRRRPPRAPRPEPIAVWERKPPRPIEEAPAPRFERAPSLREGTPWMNGDPPSGTAVQGR